MSAELRDITSHVRSQRRAKPKNNLYNVYSVPGTANRYMRVQRACFH
jgi:hypothetical protein